MSLDSSSKNTADQRLREPDLGDANATKPAHSGAEKDFTNHEFIAPRDQPASQLSDKGWQQNKDGSFEHRESRLRVSFRDSAPDAGPSVGRDVARSSDKHMPTVDGSKTTERAVELESQFKELSERRELADNTSDQVESLTKALKDQAAPKADNRSRQLKEATHESEPASIHERVTEIRAPAPGIPETGKGTVDLVTTAVVIGSVLTTHVVKAMESKEKD